MTDLLSKNFEDRMMDLKEDAAAVGGGIQNSEDNPRPRWMVVGRESITTTTADGQSSGTPSITDSDIIHQIFDRTESEALYAEAFEQTDGEDKFVQQCALATNQSDILSGLERDFRLRHRSRVRLLAHEGVNKDTMGSDGGQIQGGILEWINGEILRLSNPNPPATP
jgi:hypothetical protein